MFDNSGFHTLCSISFEANFDGTELRFYGLLANILSNDEYGGLLYFLGIVSGHRGLWTIGNNPTLIMDLLIHYNICTKTKCISLLQISWPKVWETLLAIWTSSTRHIQQCLFSPIDTILGTLDHLDSPVSRYSSRMRRSWAGPRGSRTKETERGGGMIPSD